jgi:hypothetical protein
MCRLWSAQDGCQPQCGRHKEIRVKYEFVYNTFCVIPRWAYKIQMPGNYPERNIQHTEHGESLKSSMGFPETQCHIFGPKWLPPPPPPLHLPYGDREGRGRGGSGCYFGPKMCHWVSGKPILYSYFFMTSTLRLATVLD